MYLGSQPQICPLCGSGGAFGISITHVETLCSLIPPLEQAVANHESRSGRAALLFAESSDSASRGIKNYICIIHKPMEFYSLRSMFLPI